MKKKKLNEKRAEAVMEAVIRDDGGAPEEDASMPIEDALGELFIRAGGTMDGAVSIILDALCDDKVCEHCRHKADCDLKNCGPALTEYLRKELNPDEN